jgi:hypothetical protein
MLLNPTKDWDLAADPNDLIGLVHEMERVLTASASSIDGLGLQYYWVSGGAEYHSGVSADDLLDVVASLSKPLQSIASFYTNSKSGSEHYRFKIQLVKVNSESRPVKVSVTCTGPSIDEADRLFKEIFQQFTREIGRRNRLRAAPPTQISRPSPPSRPAQTHQPRGEPTFWKVLTTNPFVVAVVAGLVVTGTFFVIALYIKDDQTDNRPTTPPSTVTKTITTQITASPGSPSPQVPR